MNEEKVITAISRITRKKAADIKAHISLGTLGLSSSFGLSALRSLLEAECETRIPALHSNLKVGDLLALLSGTELKGDGQTECGSEAATVSFPGQGNIGLGMDIQEIDLMPSASDYRTHDFYCSHFVATEIATALLKPDPRVHLCGVFCAKEAAKKSHSSLLNLRMTDLLVNHDGQGKPWLRLSDSIVLPYSYDFVLSISHTARIAAATCITVWRSSN
jgi:holo-[acyl-carrier protein] synthase